MCLFKLLKRNAKQEEAVKEFKQNVAKVEVKAEPKEAVQEAKPTDYSKLTKAELVEIAKGKGLSVGSKTKAEIIEILSK